MKTPCVRSTKVILENVMMVIDRWNLLRTDNVGGATTRWTREEKRTQIRAGRWFAGSECALDSNLPVGARTSALAKLPLAPPYHSCSSQLSKVMFAFSIYSLHHSSILSSFTIIDHGSLSKEAKDDQDVDKEAARARKGARAISKGVEEETAGARG